MSSPLETKPGPFPYRRKANGFEVLLIHQGEFARREPPMCIVESEDEAIALANARIYHDILEHREKYSPEEIPHVDDVENTIAVLLKFGLANNYMFRQLTGFAESLRKCDL